MVNSEILEEFIQYQFLSHIFKNNENLENIITKYKLERNHIGKLRDKLYQIELKWIQLLIK